MLHRKPQDRSSLLKSLEEFRWAEVQFIFNFRNLKFKAFNKSSKLKRYRSPPTSGWRTDSTISDNLIYLVILFDSNGRRNLPSNAFLISRDCKLKFGLIRVLWLASPLNHWARCLPGEKSSEKIWEVTASNCLQLVNATNRRSKRLLIERICLATFKLWLVNGGAQHWNLEKRWRDDEKKSERCWKDARKLKKVRRQSERNRKKFTWLYDSAATLSGELLMATICSKIN